ncbi:heavy-metal-associated domain-containing protein [Sphingomonas morindae]|uniref:Heavy-metal-associated domain-containing protein n=1 Tax=Sphingomonas morindae TaxID=1541170 RepID=A0ABY4X5I9_9SPHN|nr:heavy-metal-associated domain-containing protein [Sphingomonas morindae]USI72154.1 heavy-metal-associated domain-containing protein [Sphingomonas morindae]
MSIAARLPLPPLRAAAIAAGLGTLALAGWFATAQLAPGERGVPPIDSSSNFEVTGVRVDIAGRTADEARAAGWREAQRRGWRVLWARTHGAAPDAAPRLPDGTLDSIVAGIEVEQEQIGPHRYIASLAILFDRGRTGGYLGAGGATPHSAPMLVIPIEYSGGGPQSFEVRTAWQKAWARFRAGGSAIDYVRPVGTGADPLLLQLGQTRRPGRIWWRTLLDQYGAADVVVPEVWLRRRYPGGPIWARFAARHGPDATLLGSFVLTAPNSEALPAMLDQGVHQLDVLYTEALADHRLAPDPSLTIEEAAPAPEEDLIADDGEDPLATVVDQSATPPPATTAFTLQVDSADAAALDQALAALRSVPGGSAPTVTSLALGGTSIVSFSAPGDAAALRLALAARGWRLEGEGATLRMRRGGGAGDGRP